jgi:acetyl esterase/lipase
MRRGWAFAAVLGVGLPVLATAAPVAQASPLRAPLPAGQQVTIEYCNHQKARITEPATLDRPAPAAVYVHGGDWVSGNYDTGGFIINRIGPALAARGFVVVSLNYRLGPHRHWPDQIVDVKCAIRYLRANAHYFNIDPAEIGAWGQSAGGHLVALLGTAGPSAGWDIGAYTDQSSQVQAVVDMAGPSDLLTLGTRGAAVVVAKSFVSLLGKVPDIDLGADLKAASPVSYVRPGDPPFLLFVSNNDMIVNPKQSKELAWYLGEAAVPHQLVTVKKGGHAFSTKGEVPSESAIVTDIVDFFVGALVQHQPAAQGA